MFAAANNDLDLVKVLMEAGADPNIKDKQGRSVLSALKGKQSYASLQIIKTIEEGEFIIVPCNQSRAIIITSGN